MFSLFKSKEEKELKKFEPAISELIYRQIDNAFDAFVGDDKDKMGSFVMRINSQETHAYIFSFIETSCRAILPDDVSENSFGKIYMTTVSNVWRNLFNNDLLKLFPSVSLDVEGDAKDVTNCWSHYVHNEEETIKSSRSLGKKDCAAMAAYGEDPGGLYNVLASKDWVYI